MISRRYVALAVLAGAVPLAVLAVFFVVPVLGMLGLGFFPDGRLDLSGVVETLRRPRVLDALWFTVWSSAARAGGSGRWRPPTTTR